MPFSAKKVSSESDLSVKNVYHSLLSHGLIKKSRELRDFELLLLGMTLNPCLGHLLHGLLHFLQSTSNVKDADPSDQGLGQAANSGHQSEASLGCVQVLSGNAEDKHASAGVIVLNEAVRLQLSQAEVPIGIFDGFPHGILDLFLSQNIVLGDGLLLLGRLQVQLTE